MNNDSNGHKALKLYTLAVVTVSNGIILASHWFADYIVGIENPIFFPNKIHGFPDH